MRHGEHAAVPDAALSEEHHDVEVRDAAGERLATRRVRHGVAGITELHELFGELAEDPVSVVVGLETDRGLLVSSLVAAGYQVYAINPKSVDRYRDRHGLSGAKSDAGDATVLAELVRTDRHHHRVVAGDSSHVEGLKVLARSHQNLIWARTRHLNQLRHMLLEYYPAALVAFKGELGSRDALAVLGAAPHPDQGRVLSRSKIAALLRRAGRVRNLDQQAERIQAALRLPQLQSPAELSEACAIGATALVGLIGELNRQIGHLQDRLTDSFDKHPDAEIVRSQPRLGNILGARVLSEFGATPTATPILKPDVTTPEPPLSPAPRGSPKSSSLGSSATTASPTPPTAGRSRPSPAPLASGTTTTNYVPPARATVKPSEPCPTGS
jgi:transposase